MKHKVNLFLVGAAKSGTTSLYKMFGQHPDIFVGVKKEPHFFAKDLFNPSKRYRQRLCLTQEDYFKNYHNANNEAYYLDASVYYMYFEEVAQRLFDYNPEAKIIMILRSPIQRFYSHYKMLRKEGVINTSLKDFIKHPIDNNGLNVLKMGEYQNAVQRFEDLFENQCLILDFSELKHSEKVMDKICDFLNIEKIDNIRIEHENKSGIPKSSWLAYLHMNFPLTIWLKSIMPKGKFRSFLGESVLKTFYKDEPLDEAVELVLKEYYEKHP
ncbi:MAG: sulfotransferase [Erysipelothrix sp.]|nr:sulfotransferase [Erysipelothrix sp.]